MTIEITPAIAARSPLTPQQREQKNAHDRERRAMATTAKAEAKAVQVIAKQTALSHSEAPQDVFEGTIAGQQSQRDRPFQRALGASLQAADRARAERIRLSQAHQPDRK